MTRRSKRTRIKVVKWNGNLRRRSKRGRPRNCRRVYEPREPEEPGTVQTDTVVVIRESPVGKAAVQVGTCL